MSKEQTLKSKEQKLKDGKAQDFKLSEEQIDRYSRQIILPGLGGTGQKRLLGAKVLMVGAGGLGSPSIFYLAAAGVGKLGLVDNDEVELNNLHRQILHSTKDIGRLKVESGKEKIAAINPDVEVTPYPLRLTSENIMDVIADYDVVVDGSDNFPTRYLINDACVLSGKPLVHGAFYRYEGQAMVINPGEGPCYRCLFSEPPPPDSIPSCQEAGVLGALAGVIGLIQATETLKLILQVGDLLVGELIIFDALGMNFRKVKVLRDDDCPVCGKNPSITKLIDYQLFCGNDSQKERGELDE